MTTLPKINGMKIEKKLGEGGQGEVFLVQKNEKTYALKLYFQSNATKLQYRIIQHLVDSGAPAGPCAEKFAWPIELIDFPQENRFGYLMPYLNHSKYIEMGDIESGRVPHPGYGVLIEAGKQLAECFRELHIRGLCYRDASKANFMLCPKIGNIMICDNDNIVPDKSEAGGIQGTLMYMAPEVARGDQNPSTTTDMHSLAALLFMMLTGGHPLHGEIENNIRIFDGVAAKYLYGENPVFVFDPKNNSNRLPDEMGYRHVGKNWNILPTGIRSLFTKAFTEGLHNPAARITDLEWTHALSQLKDYRHICTCGAENFMDPYVQQAQTCWHCKTAVNYPAKLYIEGRTANVVLIRPGQLITTLHMGEKSSSSIVAEVEAHPANASICILRNKTGSSWKAKLDGDEMEIPPSRAIPLHPGIQLKTENAELSVYA